MTPETKKAKKKQDYYELINKIMLINPEAAFYLRTHKPNRYSGCLIDLFTWRDQPQGSDFWAAIFWELPNDAGEDPQP